MKGRVSRETRPARVRAPGPKPDACDFSSDSSEARDRSVCRHRPSVPVDHRGVSFGRERAAVAFATHLAGVVEGPRLVRVQRDLLAHAVLVVGQEPSRGALRQPDLSSRLPRLGAGREASEHRDEEEERLGAGESSHRDRTRFERRHACEGGDATGASASGSTASARRGVRSRRAARAAAIRSRKRGRISRATIDPPVVVVVESSPALRALLLKNFGHPRRGAASLPRAGRALRGSRWRSTADPGPRPGRATRRRCARVAPPLVRPALPFHPSSSVLQRPRALAVVVSALLPPPSPPVPHPRPTPPRSSRRRRPRRALSGRGRPVAPPRRPPTPPPPGTPSSSRTPRAISRAPSRARRGRDRPGGGVVRVRTRHRRRAAGAPRALARPDPRGHRRGRARGAPLRPARPIGRRGRRVVVVAPYSLPLRSAASPSSSPRRACPPRRSREGRGGGAPATTRARTRRSLSRASWRRGRATRPTRRRLPATAALRLRPTPTRRRCCVAPPRRPHPFPRGTRAGDARVRGGRVDEREGPRFEPQPRGRGRFLLNLGARRTRRRAIARRCASRGTRRRAGRLAGDEREAGAGRDARVDRERGRTERGEGGGDPRARRAHRPIVRGGERVRARRVATRGGVGIERGRFGVAFVSDDARDASSVRAAVLSSLVREQRAELKALETVRADLGGRSGGARVGKRAARRADAAEAATAARGAR